MEKYKDEEWLREQYKENTVKEMAKKADCSPATISRWRDKLGLKESFYKEITCDFCEKQFEKLKSRIEEYNFCSRECYYKWQRDGGAPTGEDHPNYSQRQVKCTYCGNEFSIEKNHFEKRENFFCSHECYAKYLQDGWIWGICEACGDRYLKRIWKFKRSDHHFCSQECSEEFHKGEKAGAWKGGYEPYYGGPIWEQQRKEALERDNYKCQICGKEEELVVHHKVPVRIFKEGRSNEEVNWKEVNKLSNLQTLCRSCHRMIESRESNNLFKDNIG